MDQLTLTFDPLAPLSLVLSLAGLAAVAGVAALRRRAGLRLLAIAALALALANPALVREERTPLADIVALVVDESASMQVGARAEAAEAAVAAVRAQVERDPTLDLVETRADRGDDGTYLFDAVGAALAQIPRERLAGVITVTDGRIHDAPEDQDASRPTGDREDGLTGAAPLHALIVGDRTARDRRLVVERAPQFGIVDERVTFDVRIDDPGAPDGELADVRFSVDGGEPFDARIPIGETTEIGLELERRGANVVEIVAAPSPAGDISLLNNRAAVSVAGVRDRLRVLLITGEPHAGARAWRDLLKSDPSVDLVHFTILRPPEKQDGTPIDELSLIAFPTRELFEEKLSEFDLVIFDRYRRRGVLRMLYLDNITRYVEGGGALLVAAGPAYASPFSLHRTPLAAVLPARPQLDGVIDGPFRPAVTEVGRAHPVTSGFVDAPTDSGAQAETPRWGRWFRMIDARPVAGETVLSGAEDRPLLMLDRFGEGRVALLLSDHAWLWSRGVEGGGPYGELFRRLSHWLMQEPELEEERLTARLADDMARIERRTMGAAPDPVRLIAPSGAETEAPFAAVSPGLYVAEAALGETGLYSVRSGDLTSVLAVGPLNPREFADLSPSDAVLAASLRASGGGAVFIGEGANPSLPELRRTRASGVQAGRAWLGLARRGASSVTAYDRQPLAPALLAVALVLALSTLAWAREGR